jgi:membrane protease YdiL (CAAX protease family)
MTKRLGIALVAFVIWLGITIFLGKFLAGGEDMPLQEVVSRGIGWTWIIAGAFILAVCLWQGWNDVGLKRGAALRDWRFGWLPMVYIVAALGLAAAFGLPPATAMTLILVNCFSVGFSEELMLRGAVLQGFRHSFPIWPAVLLTSAMFGAMHSLNVFVTGDLKQALIQSTASFLSGILFIALRLRTGSLWPPIVIHGLWDFATFTLGAAAGGAHHGSLPAEALATPELTGLTQLAPVLLVLPNAAYGLWLMRDIGRTHADPET